MKHKNLKQLPSNKIPKADRQQALLFGLIELYVKTGKPIGSQTIQEQGFESLSSATIRNYFAKLDEAGFLKQPHTSGGRIPTDKAFKLYAQNYQGLGFIEKSQETTLDHIFNQETKQVTTLLNQAADAFSEMTQCAVFFSTPRFDQDFIQNVLLVALDPARILAILITDFGAIHTESLYLDRPHDATFLHTCQEYFLWRLNKGEKPLFKTEAETKMAQRIYNEIMVRHVVGYANFPNEEIFKTGFSKLLSYSEFNDASALASSLSLLEDESIMRAILRKSIKTNQLQFWIGEDLTEFTPMNADCTVISIPYYINQIAVGSIAILGPSRLAYRNIFGLCQYLSEKISNKLTSTLYKYKISFRQPTNSEKLIENKPARKD